MESRIELIKALGKYASIVIWGLKEDTNSTHRHIHRHLFMILSKLGCNVLWCENRIENNDLIPDGSLVLSSEQCYGHIRYNKNNSYALFHACSHIPDCRNYLNLRVYGEIDIMPDSAIWGPTTAFDKQSHLLYQSLTTNLLPEEFLPPVFNTNNLVYWVGSIWNDAINHGNIKNMDRLKAALQRHNIAFHWCQNITDEENICRIRESRIAPSIGGQFQTTSMLPCRFWKNISYGQLGITNLKKSVDIFKSCVIYNDDISELIDTALTIDETKYKEMTAYQQSIIAREYTYLNWLSDIVRAFDELGIQ